MIEGYGDQSRYPVDGSLSPLVRGSKGEGGGKGGLAVTLHRIDELRRLASPEHTAVEDDLPPMCRVTSRGGRPSSVAVIRHVAADWAPRSPLYPPQYFWYQTPFRFKLPS